MPDFGQTLYTVGALLATLSGCRTERPRWTPPDRTCPGALRPVWVADSSLTICVVTSFRTHDLRTWTREREGRLPDVFEIRTDVSETQVALTGGWPPTLRGAPAGSPAGGETTDSIVARADTVAGLLAHTEVGVVHGAGSPGRGAFAFISGWSMGGGRRGIARGQSTESATLDTLLLMLHSAEPWQRGHTEPR